MSEQPEGWAATTIGALCELINGKAFKPKDWTEEGLLIVRIQNLNRPDAPFNRFDGEVVDKFKIDSGQLLFAWSGTPGTSFGAHVWNGGPAVLNQHIFKVEIDEEHLDREFFRKAINQTLDELISKAHGGVGLRHVTKGVFEATAVPLPPLPEQRRIVAKLDRLSARTKAARAHLARVQSLATRAKQAIRSAAFDGTLTRVWRQANGHADVTFEPLASVCASLTDGDHQAPPKADEGIAFITISAINDGYLRLEKATRYVPQSYRDGLKETRKAVEGDILFSVTGSISIPALVDTSEPFVFQRHIAILKPDQRKVTSRYLLHILGAAQIKEQAFQVATGTAQLTIPLGKLRAFAIPVPALEEQDEIVRRIEAAFDRIDRMVEEAMRAAHLLNRLDQRLLTKAFRGDLVPQDPTDEPADQLLARIQAARAAAPKPQRGRRTRA